jgi:hypothetical protein
MPEQHLAEAIDVSQCDGSGSVAPCDAKLLSHVRTQSLPHAALRNFLAQSGSEVTVMAKMEEKEYERRVAAIIEHTLHTLVHTDLTVAEIIDAAHEKAQRMSGDAATLQ